MDGCVGVALGLELGAAAASGIADGLILSLCVALRGGGFFCGCAIELPSAFSNSPSERASSAPLIIKNPEIDNVRINRARYWFMRRRTFCRVCRNPSILWARNKAGGRLTPQRQPCLFLDQVILRSCDMLIHVITCKSWSCDLSQTQQVDNGQNGSKIC